MTKKQTLILAALVAAATFQTALAGDPASPVPGAVCNLYLGQNGNFSGIAESLPQQPAAATFVDTASDFKACGKKPGIDSYYGMWTGWMKVERGGTCTFVCNGGGIEHKVWINGQVCASGDRQHAFNVDLHPGFNSVKIIFHQSGGQRNLALTYKRAGSLKEPVPFGPENMFYEEEEE